jgi:hypothetical protein
MTAKKYQLIIKLLHAYTSEIKMLLFYNMLYLELISIISETGAAIWSKTNFGPAAHNHPRSSPLPHIGNVPSPSAIF